MPASIQFGPDQAGQWFTSIDGVMTPQKNGGAAKVLAENMALKAGTEAVRVTFTTVRPAAIAEATGDSAAEEPHEVTEAQLGDAVLGMSAPDIVAHVKAGDCDDDLAALEAAEREGRNRVTVIRAIAARRDEIAPPA